MNLKKTLLAGALGIGVVAMSPVSGQAQYYYGDGGYYYPGGGYGYSKPYEYRSNYRQSSYRYSSRYYQNHGRSPARHRQPDRIGIQPRYYPEYGWVYW